MALARSLPWPGLPDAADRPRGWPGDAAALLLVTTLHGALLAGLMLAREPDPPNIAEPARLEVELIAEAAPVSSAPILSADAAPALGVPDGDDAPLPDPAPPPMPTPAPPIPEPIAPPPPAPAKAPPPKAKPVDPKPIPAPAPKPVAKPVPRPAPSKTPPKAAATKAAPAKAAPSKSVSAKAASATGSSAKAAPAKTAAATKASGTPTKTAGARPTGRLDGIAASVARTGNDAAAKGAPAATASAAVRKSIDVSIKGAVRTPWNQCRLTGVDVDRLETEVRFRLTRTGALDGFTSVTTTGQTESNRPQVARHQECARKAIQLAAPFTLPPEAYASWQNYTLDFVKR